MFGFLVPEFVVNPLGGINKDSLNCGYSPHFEDHPTAVALAIKATIQYIEDIKEKLTDSELRLLFGVGPTLAFVIDTTGSMADIISSVSEQSIEIVTKREGTPDEPNTYVVAPFNDPTTGPVTTTSDFATFKTSISSLTAFGGGDCPELSITGMLNAVDILNEGASLFMMTDAAPKDADLAGELISAATAKNINIYPFKFDSLCDDSLAKRQDSVSNGVYAAIALATGGQYHSLPRSEVGIISGLIDAISKGDSSSVLKITDTASSGAPISYNIPVDSLMTEVSVSLRGIGVTFAIAHPDGSLLDLTGAGVTSTVLSDGHFVTIKTPADGAWIVTIKGPGSFTLDVTGISSLHFSSFEFVAIGGRPGHTGYFPIIGPPAYDHDVAAIGTLEGAFSSAKFNFRSPAGAVVVDAAMKAGTGDFGDPPTNSFFGVLSLIPGTLFVYVSGLDTAGKPYQRVLPSVITPFKSNTIFTGIVREPSPDTNSTSHTNSTIPAPANSTSMRLATNSTSTSIVGTHPATATISGSPRPHLNVSSSQTHSAATGCTPGTRICSHANSTATGYTASTRIGSHANSAATGYAPSTRIGSHTNSTATGYTASTRIGSHANSAATRYTATTRIGSHALSYSTGYPGYSYPTGHPGHSYPTGHLRNNNLTIISHHRHHHTAGSSDEYSDIVTKM